MLHLSPIAANRILNPPMLCLLLSAACKSVEPAFVSPPLVTDQTEYVLGAGVWGAPMRATYTNTRTDTVYFLLACWGTLPTPGRHAVRVDGSGREAFVENLACLTGSSNQPRAIAVAPGATFTDTASLHVSAWISSDPAYSQAAVVGRFQLVYDLCIMTRMATASATCDTLPVAQRVTNAFDVVGPTP